MNNIIRHELKTGIKPFLWWTLGQAALMIAGMYKFLGFNAESGTDVNILFSQFPKIILAMLGVVNADIQTLGGYYAVLETYILIVAAIFAIHLGATAVSREMIDKTYEFVFTKPRSRVNILGSKLGAGLVYLCLFCLANLIFSFFAIRFVGLENTIRPVIYLYAVNAFLVGLVFFSLTSVLSALFSRAEWGMKASNALFILSYIIAVFFDLAEHPGLLKLFTPLRYFEAKDLLNGTFDVSYLMITLALSMIFLGLSLWLFKRKDLKAV